MVTKRMPTLLAFKHSILQDPQRVLISWNDSFHFCQWKGVTCGGKLKRIAVLDFISRGLVGSLSPYIGNLSILRVLSIYNNTFYGQIPHEIGRLFRLQRLDLNMNNFEGEIPANISNCYNLEYLGVGFNKLVGIIPQELSALSRLTTLAIHKNSFTGGIPCFFGNMTSLETLSAAANLFGGNIPDSIGQLKNLSELGLGGNNLNGLITPSVYNLSLLTVLSLADNQLEGSILPSIGLMLPRLQYLQLSINRFTGTLPISFSNCSDLVALEIMENNFHGKIAVEFGGLKSIRHIVLNHNNFVSGEPDEMNFIGSITNCSNLEVLGLQFNKLKGMLPNSVGNLSTQLFYLNLAGNFIYGRLPSTIGNLVGVTSLGLDDNQFTGLIPTSMGNLRNIQRLSFERNRFSGTIPDSIGNLSFLSDLNMKMNMIEGIIPISLGNCQRLLLVELSENNLTGPIPKELFRLSALSITLNLSRNHLLGFLPVEVGNLKNLAGLDLSMNDLSGEIPSSLGSCTSLENLYLQGNLFQGPISPSFSSLRGMINLDLSHNNLSGHIPRFLEKFSLKYLNLSFNNFEGEVPKGGVFSNGSAISIVGNTMLCGGLPEFQLGKCITKESKKKNQSSLALIIVISGVCIVLMLVCVLFLVLFFRHKKRRTVQSSGSLLREPFLRVSYEMLLKATSGFSSENLLGMGSFGSVYKGILQVNGTGVAVKVLNLESRGASNSFMIECEALRNVRHRNLVKIITSCSSVDFHGNDFKALVYDLMVNGSLEKWLHSSPEAHNEQDDQVHKLNLFQRINIATDVACALDYLHYWCENPIIHCDLKPSIILLDGDMVAHVGDFGLAKFLLPERTDAIQSNSIGLRGSIGYVAPEYGLGSEISTNGDVYSFGILLLEMITGKRPTDNMFREGLNLHNFVDMALPDRVTDIVDPIILKDNEAANIMECLVSLLKIGVACSLQSPQDRMNITNVFHELNVVRNIIAQR